MSVSKSKQKSCLIAGGGYADIPLIRAAKKLGYFVITCGSRDWELGHKESDEFVQIDYSDKRAVLKFAQDRNIQALCAACNDFSALTCAYVAEELELPGHDSYNTAQTVHLKDLFATFATHQGLQVPRSEDFSDPIVAANTLAKRDLPLIIKPVDLTGGKGISVVRSRHEVADALQKAFAISRAKRIVVQEYLEGTRHGFSTMLVGGKVKFYFADNEHYYLNPYMVAAASTPTTLPLEAVQQLIRYTERLAELLQLVDGIVHTQLIYHKEKVHILETCRRAPGDLYIRLVEHACGVDYSRWIVQSAFGLDVCDIRQSDPTGFLSRNCIMAARHGVIKEIRFSPRIQQNLAESFMFYQSGDCVEDPLTNKLGIVFLKHRSSVDMLETCDRFHELVAIEYK